jgi:glycosyltransferase involved in cell wall biosynthesis
VKDKVMMPEIAVLMPVYNPTVDEIARTLESLREQDEAFHLFLVDDGSSRKPDYTRLLDGIDHTLIELPSNQGITGALNAGLGALLKLPFRYIARIDCGDLALPGRFRKQRQFMQAHPELAIIGTYNQVLIPHLNGSYTARGDGSEKAIARDLQYNSPLSHPTMMLRPDVFRKIGLYSNAFDAAEDYELVRRADRAGLRISIMPEVLLLKIEDGNSISQRKRKKQLASRLRIQWKYRDLANVHSIAGMLRTMLQIVLPQKLIHQAKMLRRNFPGRPRPA